MMVVSLAAVLCVLQSAPAAPTAAPALEAGKEGCCRKGVPLPWKGYNRGVRWTYPMEAALERARDERKLLMVFYLVGDLDKEGC